MPKAGIRTPAFSSDLLREIYESADPVQSLRVLLAEREDIRETLALASPSLSIGIERWIRGSHADENIAVSALAYFARCTTRATPLAACAAVGLVPVTEGSELFVDEPVRRRTRPDFEWLYKLAHAAESDPAVIPNLRLRRSGLTHPFNGRLQVFDVARTHVQTLGSRSAVVTVPTALNFTPAVRKAVELCEPGITAGELSRALARDLGVPAESAFELIAKLLEVGILITELRLPPTGDPDGALIDVLQRVAPETARAVRQVIELLEQNDDAPLGRASAALARAQEIAGGLAPAEHYWHVNGYRRYRGGLPAQTASRIARVLEQLARITPAAANNPSLARMFEQKYNSGREVALLALLDPDEGLRFEELRPITPSPSLERRQIALLDLCVTAIAQNQPCVDLDERDLQRLTVEHQAEELPEHMEAICSLMRDAGGVLQPAYVGGAFEGCNRSLMRFHRVLDALDDSNEADGEEITAEFVSLTHARRSANIVMRPHRDRYEVVAGVFGAQSDERTIPLDDIVAGVEHGRLYLRSKRLNKRLRVRESHMLNADTSSRIAKFFSLACARDLASTYFDWGEAARRLPYTPACAIDGVRVALQTWRIPKALASDWDSTASRAWRRQWRVPQSAYLVAKDNRLLLDLRHDICVAQIKRAAARLPDDGVVELQEAVPSLDNAAFEGFDGNYFAEVDATFRVRAERTPARVMPREPETVEPSVFLRPPGSEWLFIKAYVARERMSYFIEKTLAEAVRALEPSADLMHFLRYADPDHHVRIRFRANDAGHIEQMYARALRMTSGWVNSGVLARVVYDTYDREVERYGGTPCIDHAERIFALSSRLALSQMHLCRTSPHNNATVIAALTDFCAALCEGEERALAWFRSTFGRRQQLSAEQWAVVRAMPESRLDLAAVTQTASSIERRLPPERFSQVLRALVHMHCNRIGLWVEEEQRVLQVVFAALERRAARSHAHAHTVAHA